MDKSHFFLWIKKHCPFCQMATGLLTDNEIPYTVYEISENLDLLSEVQNRFDWKTVPVVLEQKPDGDRKFIGGFTDLKEYLNEEAL